MGVSFRVTVTMPVYNGDGALLAAAAQSVLSQGPLLERLIVVDDGSTAEDTREALAALAKEPVVQVMRHPRNRGVASARNTGIAAARSPWIGFLDADDLYEPGWLEAAAAAAQRHPEAQWIKGQIRHLLPDATISAFPSIAEMLGADFGDDGSVWHSCDALTRLLLGGGSVQNNMILVRRELMDRAGAFYEGLHYFEDHFLWLKLARLAPLLEQNAPAAIHRHRIRSLTRSSGALSAKFAIGWSRARRDPLLAEIRKELRWSEYSIWKALALRNLYHGHRGRALRFAARALAMDPREIGAFATFLRLMRLPPERLREEGVRYSRAPLGVDATLATDPAAIAPTPATRISAP